MSAISTCTRLHIKVSTLGGAKLTSNDYTSLPKYLMKNIFPSSFSKCLTIVYV